MFRLKRIPDPWLLLSVFGLIAVGLIANYSTSLSESGSRLSHFDRQLVWTGVGVLVLLITAAIPTKFFQSLAYPIYGLSVLALMLLLVAARPEAGASRWLSIGPFNLQPSEFAKMGLVLGLARFLSDRPRDLHRPWVTLVAIIVALFPMGLTLIQPDLGTSLVFPVILFCLLAWAGVPLLHLLLLITPVLAVITSWQIVLHLVTLAALVLAVVLCSRRTIHVVLTSGIFLLLGAAAPMLWGRLHPYQQRRLLTFLDPEADPLGSAYQLIQSKIAIGSGGVTGKGFLQGTQTQLKFLPEGHTDFIFSAWAEEFGFLGAAIVVGLFFVIFYRGVALAAKCRNRLYAMTAIGVVCVLTFQALSNLMMTVGFLPVTGLPLPFLSYGGSSMISSMFAVGLLLGIDLRWREY